MENEPQAPNTPPCRHEEAGVSFFRSPEGMEISISCLGCMRTFPITAATLVQGTEEAHAYLVELTVPALTGAKE